MGKSNKERQAEYRERRYHVGEKGERRLNTWVATETMLALERLARQHGLTKRAMLEQLIRQADSAHLASLDMNGPDWARYFDPEP